MKVDELIPRAAGAAATIARQLVHASAKEFAPQDLEKAVTNAINRFTLQLRRAAQNEIRFVKMRRPEEAK